MQNDKTISGFQITNSRAADLDTIFELFESAIAYQQKKGFELWPNFSRTMIGAEISEGRHWKIMDGKTIACILSVMYNDPVIWGPERDKEPSVYLHRIAIHPQYKGRGMMTVIREWALEHARTCNKLYVRMDTWGNNVRLREYYMACGFPYIGQQYLQDTEGLPAHYGGSVLSLFQLKA